MTKILFVCHGNICRSPMAEFILKQLAAARGCADAVSVESCAVSREEIGSDMYPPAKQKLREKGVPFTPRRARQLTQADYDRADLILAMDQSNLRLLRRLIGGDPAGKVRLLGSYAGSRADISDPWYTGDFETAYQDILRGCIALLDTLGI